MHEPENHKLKLICVCGIETQCGAYHQDLWANGKMSEISHMANVVKPPNSSGGVSMEGLQIFRFTLLARYSAKA